MWQFLRIELKLFLNLSYYFKTIIKFNLLKYFYFFNFLQKFSEFKNIKKNQIQN